MKISINQGDTALTLNDRIINSCDGRFATESVHMTRPWKFSKRIHWYRPNMIVPRESDGSLEVQTGK